VAMDLTDCWIATICFRPLGRSMLIQPVIAVKVILCAVSLLADARAHQPEIPSLAG